MFSHLTLLVLLSGTPGPSTYRPEWVPKPAETHYLKDGAEIIGFLGVSYFVWNVVHEGSHAITAHSLGGKIERFEPYPHKVNDTFVWGQATYNFNKRLPPKEKMVLSMAPRAMDLLAIIAFPFTAKLDRETQKVVGPLVAGGVIDLFVGSLGISPQSDLRQAFPNKQQRDIVRGVGIGLVVISITAWWMINFKHYNSIFGEW